MLRLTLPAFLAFALVLPLAARAQDDAGASDAAAPAVADTGEVAKVERNNRRDNTEVEAYKAIQKRFSERAQEFEADVRRYLGARKSEELDKISDGYDALVQTLEERERAQRDLAIDRLREFLVRYPGVPDADNVRFRLAELYYEKSVENWLEAQANFSDMEAEYDRKYEEALKALDAGDPTLFEQLEELSTPKKDLARSIELYQQIIARNEPLDAADRWPHLDRAYYSLGFAYMDTGSDQHDFLKARKAFQELLRVAGEQSSLADAAHMFLGKLLFEEEKRFEEALDEYKAIVEKGPKGSYYDDASFQLAWTYYKLAGLNPDYEPKALDLFTRLLDDSELARKESGKESPFAPDARLNMARTLADIAGRNTDQTPVDVTERYFNGAGERPWERQVYLSLAEVLAGCVPVPDACPPGTQNFGRWEIDAGIDVYEKLQTDPRWVKEPDNPAYQMKIIWLLPQKDIPNLDEDIPLEQKTLVERYSETIRDPYTGDDKPNPWWVANRNNPDALDNVRQYVEGSLAQVAIGLMQEAQNSNEPGVYRAAADKFREYLDKFPIADNFFSNQWYLANALMKAEPKDPARPWGSYDEALREFTSLVQSRDNHPYGDGALFGIMAARREVINAKADQYGPIDERPLNAEIEEVITNDFGKSITRYKLSDDHQTFIDAMDLLVDHEFGEPIDDTLPDYREAFADNKAYLLYTPGLILAKHNRYPEARERLERVIELVPDTQEASFAAQLIVSTYNDEGDLQEVRNQTRRFMAMAFDDPAMTDKFGDLYKDVSFIQCQELKNAGDRQGAAECFERYLSEFTDTADEKYQFALYNAANNYELVGRAEKANELFERYVELYPKDEQSRVLFIRIANNYEATFDLDKAIYYYQKLVDNDPRREFPGTSDALYNVAFLKIGLGDHRGAAVGYENYSRLFRDTAEDAEDVMFRAGEQWEEVSEREALKFYDRYLAAYGKGKDKSNPSHVIEVLYRIAQLNKDRQKVYEKAMDEVQSTFDAYLAEGQQLGREANRYAAERAFQKLLVAYADLIDEKLTGDEDKDAALQEQKALVEVPAFEEQAKQLLTTYKDFEYGTGAFYHMAAARLYIAELGYAMECPSKYSEEECDIWWEIYDEQIRPQFEEFEATARGRFEGLIQQGKDQKQHSVWIDRAYETLNRLDPFSFPDVKTEVRGDSDVKALPPMRPVDIPDPDAKKGRGGAPAPAPEQPAPDEGADAPTPPADSPWGGQ